MYVKENLESFPPLEKQNVQFDKHDPIEIPIRYQAGALYPQCRQGILDYDGLLNLVCPVCGQGHGGMLHLINLVAIRSGWRIVKESDNGTHAG
jgi:hypothetical protein